MRFVPMQFGGDDRAVAQGQASRSGDSTIASPFSLRHRPGPWSLFSKASSRIERLMAIVPRTRISPLIVNPAGMRAFFLGLGPDEVQS